MSHSLTRNGDVEIAYRVVPQTGEPSGRTLLMIMGVMLTSSHWGDDFLTSLARHRRLVLFDNRGTGASTKRVSTITAEAWTADTLAVLEAVGADSVDVLGYSMDGRIAQELALRHPARVESLLFLASVIGGRDAVPPEPAGMAALMPRRDCAPEVAVRDALTNIAAPGFATSHADRLEELTALTLAQPTHGSIVGKQVAVLESHVANELGGLTLPTMIIHGDKDPLVPVGNGRALAKSMPHAELVELTDVGHLPTWEAPERMREHTDRFYG